MLSSYPDQELLLLIRGGNEQAFDELFHRYFKTIYKQAFALLRSEAEAEEIVHDVLLEIWKGRTDLQIENVGGYLRVAVRRRAISHVTSSKRSRFYEVFDQTLESPYLSDSTLLGKDLIELISAWADALPEKRRQVFIRHFFEQRSVKEIAKEMGISEKTVYAQIALALEDMRKRYAHLLPILYLFLFREQ